MAEPEQTPERPPNRRGGTAVPWVTFFLDLLGWSRKLLEFDRLIDYRQDQQRVDRTIQEAIVDFQGTRITVEGILRGGSLPEVQEQRAQHLKALSGLNRALMEEIHTDRFVYKSFGDCFVVSMPAGGHKDFGFAPSAFRINSLLTLAGSAILLLLSTKIPVRGAIEIGVGTQYDPVGGGPPEFLGASLAKAYQLESREADYPRILVGRDLFSYVTSMAQDVKEPIDLRVTKPQAEKMLKLLHPEADGTVSLDYLHPDILQVGAELAPGRVDAAYRFVMDGFVAANQANNGRLVGMYGLACQYFLTRLQRPPPPPSPAPGTAPGQPTAGPPGTPPPTPSTPSGPSPT